MLSATLEAIFQNLNTADVELKPLVHQFLKDKVGGNTLPTRHGLVLKDGCKVVSMLT